MYKPFLLPTAEISKDVSNYSVGFVLLNVSGNEEDAVSAGSGSLVTIGLLHGILTAAHVLEALPRNGKVGIVLYVERPSQFSRHVISMESCERVTIHGAEFGEKGPDLGFLRLSEPDIGWLKAKNSFYNLSKHREDALAHRVLGKGNVDSLVGMIHEFTEDLPPDRPWVRRKSFGALFCSGRPISVKYVGDADVLEFQLSPEASFNLPNSFEGASGGAIWRFFVEEKNGLVGVVGRRLVGIPFFQKHSHEGKRLIIFHGTRSIYQVLYQRIVEEWPKEAIARG